VTKQLTKETSKMDNMTERENSKYNKEEAPK